MTARTTIKDELTFLVSQYSPIPRCGSNSLCKISLAYWILADFATPRNTKEVTKKNAPIAS